MAKQLAALLRTNMGLPDLAEQVRRAGRGGDTILAHINPREAELLKRHGGSGKINPYTGLPQFDDTGEDPNAGEAEAQQYQQDNPAPVQEPSPAALANTDSTANVDPQTGQNQPLPSNGPTVTPAPTGMQDPAQAAQANQQTPPPVDQSVLDKTDYPSIAPVDQTALDKGNAPDTSALVKGLNTAMTPNYGGYTTGSAGNITSPSQIDAARKAQSSTVASGGTGLPTTIPVSATGTSSGFDLNKALSTVGGSISDLSKALGTNPAGLAKAGILGAGAVQANTNSKAMQDTAAANEAAIKALADPYNKQGAELLAKGQAGELTGPQQQQLEAVRAQMAQQAANSGQTGGTGQQQIDATIQRMAQQFSNDNINEGMKLMQVGDSYIQQAISTGYLQNKDAMALSSDFYKYLAGAIPDLAVDIDPTTGQQKVKP